MDPKEYDNKVMNGFFKKVYPVIAQQIIQRTGVINGNCIDLGGGPGMLGICLAAATSLKVTICDPLQGCIDLVQKNCMQLNVNDRVDAVVGRAEDLQFHSNSIDLVASRGSIFFWENQAKGLEEVFRVLKPGGWAYIGGGFGNIELLREVQAAKANDQEWERSRKERIKKNPPGHYVELLETLGIKGFVEWDEAGTWIIFQKPIN